MPKIGSKLSFWFPSTSSAPGMSLAQRDLSNLGRDGRGCANVFFLFCECLFSQKKSNDWYMFIHFSNFWYITISDWSTCAKQIDPTWHLGIQLQMQSLPIPRLRGIDVGGAAKQAILRSDCSRSKLRIRHKLWKKNTSVRCVYKLRIKKQRGRLLNHPVHGFTFSPKGSCTAQSREKSEECVAQKTAVMAIIWP